MESASTADLIFSLKDEVKDLKTKLTELQAENLEMSRVQSESKQQYNELKSNVDCIESEIQEINLNLADVQERNFAFKYRVGYYKDAVKTDQIVKFDTQIHGTGVGDGVFTAPIDGLYEIKYNLDFYKSKFEIDDCGYYVQFKIRKNGLLSKFNIN